MDLRKLWPWILVSRSYFFNPGININLVDFLNPSNWNNFELTPGIAFVLFFSFRTSNDIVPNWQYLDALYSQKLGS